TDTNTIIINTCAVSETTTGMRTVIDEPASEATHGCAGVATRVRSALPSTSHTSRKLGEMSSRSASNSSAYLSRHVFGYKQAAQRIRVLMLPSIVGFQCGRLVRTAPAASLAPRCLRQ